MNRHCDHSWNAFLTLCRATTSNEQLQDLLTLFLTAEEKNNINNRYLIIKALLENRKPQREIARELGVSIAKITRGSNYLKLIDQALKHFLIANITEK